MPSLNSLKQFRGLALLLGVLSSPAIAGAHVKWFIDEPTTDLSTFKTVLAEPAVLGGTGILLLAVLIAGIIEKKNHRRFLPAHWTQLFERWRFGLVFLLQIAVAASLLFNAWHGTLLVPHQPASFLFQILEVVAAILLLIPQLVPAGAAVLIVCWLGLFTEGVALAEYTSVAGIALFLGLEKIDSDSFLATFRRHRHTLLHIALGISLIVLAFSEKLLILPEASQMVATYKLNFLPLSDQWFTIMAGGVELFLGTLLFLGFLPRLAVLAFFGFLVASNTYFFSTGYAPEGVKELFGHLPLIGAGVIVLSYGKNSHE